MADQFRSFSAGVEAPAIGAYPIVPTDATDLADPIRAVTISVSGTLSFVSSRTGLTHTTNVLPPGTYPIFASRIRATGTTATGLTGWI